MNKNFKFNWFDGQIPLFNHFLLPFKNKENLRFLEIGSFEGKSTCWCLDNILTGKNNKITCIDSWEGGSEHSDLKMLDIEKSFLLNINERKNDVEILKGLSKKCLLSIQDREDYYDFIYVDGGHTAKDVIEDLVLSFPLLKANGIMAMDDFMWGSPNHDPNNIKQDHLRPEYSIKLFLLAYQNEIKVTHFGGQVWLTKL